MQECPRPIFISSQILTKDSVTVFVNAIMYYRVQDAESAIANVDDYRESARLLAATTLRNVLGTKNLGAILSGRDSIAKEMQELLIEATEPWGVVVERVEVKDVRVPEQLMRAMAAEAEADREAKAKIIAAEGEYKASKAMRQAADIISENPAALQVCQSFFTVLLLTRKTSVALSSNPEQHLGREQQHHHLPSTGGHSKLYYACREQQTLDMFGIDIFIIN